MELLNLWLSFLAGVSAPLLAVCVLPLYPGFLAYLSNQLTGKESKSKVIVLGLVAVSGVIVSMGLVGLIFTFIFQESLTSAIGIISPIAFGLLAIVSLFMIFNFDLTKVLPQMSAPIKKNPYLSSFLFGAFFGAIVLPCNPASLIVLFALSTSTTSFVFNFLNFVLYGLGMGLPLLILAVLSSSKSTNILSWLTKHKRMINIIAGVLMLGISLYYLIFVFGLFG